MGHLGLMVFLQHAMSYSTVPLAKDKVCLICTIYLLANNPFVKLTGSSEASLPGTVLSGSCLGPLQGSAQGQHQPRTGT